ncbi:MAG: LPXTG cell wall anchor domain-containing protein [Solirubrobacteraceae bacterium]
MRTPRWLATCIMLLGALVLAVPAVTLASGGGSAGDQQYTDPFSGTPAPSKSKSESSTTTSTAPATPAPTSTSAPPATTPVASTQTSSDPTTPTATIASSTAGQLPHTGYDSRLAAVLGFALVGGGLVLRAGLRRT